MVKNKYITLFLVLCAVLFFANMGCANAWEINPNTLPKVPMLPELSENSSLADFVSYWIGLLIYISGFLSLISFVIGAVGLINPNIEAHSDAKDRMKGAVLGLVLTMASVVILRTINISFITPTLSPLSGVEGVFLTNGTENKSCPQREPDVSTITPKEFNKIKYVCSKEKGANSPNLMVWTFPKTNYRGYDEVYRGVNVSIVPCGEETSVGSGSFVIDYETPGIYYYMGMGCSGYASGVNTSSQDSINSPFKGNIKSIKIVNDLSNNIAYGAIFHKQIGLANGGECSKEPLIDELCNPVDISAFAVNIFKLNELYSAGDGVSFYSAPREDVTGARAGFYDISDAKIKYQTPFSDFYPEKMEFVYNGVDRPQSYQDGCKTFQNCSGSIKIRGNYLVALYSKTTKNFPNYCQTFTKDVPNLKVEPFLASGIKSLDLIYIIPRQ